MKPIRFLGNSLEALCAFPEAVRRRAGHELFMVQTGRIPADFKPIGAIGEGAMEIRIADRAGAFRVLYVAKFGRAVFVLHAFQKKTNRTPHAEIQLAARRYRLIREHP